MIGNQTLRCGASGPLVHRGRQWDPGRAFRVSQSMYSMQTIAFCKVAVKLFMGLCSNSRPFLAGSFGGWRDGKIDSRHISIKHCPNLYMTAGYENVQNCVRNILAPCLCNPSETTTGRVICTLYAWRNGLTAPLRT